MNIINLSVDKAYNRWAKYYDNNNNPMTAIDSMIFERNFPFGEIYEKMVLDIGCGTGRISSQLANAGAKLTGIDISENMLEIARKKDNKSHYFFHDLAKTLPFESNFFDFIVSNLVLEHIADLNLLFKEIARVVKPNAYIYISAMHPAMMLKSTQANFKDPETGLEYRPKGYPNQISDFVNHMNKAKLQIQEMNEYSPSDKLITNFPKARKYRDWPMLLTFRLSLG